MLKNGKIIEKMSLEEKALMFSGCDMWSTVAYEQYGIPSVFLSDGPHGLRKQAGEGDHLGLNASLPATCYPTAAGMANSWDEELAEELGRHLGIEAQNQGVQVILGPGLNIKRNPLCGRNFEYFSEDPLLAGKMAAAYIRGIQSEGVSACPKHFIANSQETRRMSNNSVIDERTFREIYATGFEIAVKEGHPKSIMSSYNMLNGEYTNENKKLLQDILRDEWGFDGFVVSDWGGSNDHVLGVKNGSNLEMPSTGKHGAKEIIDAVNSGILTQEELDTRLDELLSVVFELDKNRKKTEYDKREFHKFARKAARESIVLLKNDNNILPLKNREKVALLGEFAETPRYQGAGSSLVNAIKVDSMLDEIAKTELNLVAFEKGYMRSKVSKPAMIKKAVEVAKEADYVIIAAGLDENSEVEGMERTTLKMPKNQNELIEAVAKECSNVIVVLMAGAPVEMPWINDVSAVVHGYLGGEAGAGAILDVITGKYNPSGRLAETYPLKYEDVPSYNYYPGKERNSEYRESLYVGYRYYETVEKSVLFPFGYGLSYTQFEYSDLKVSEEGAFFTITNTGKLDGSETAQLYVGRKSEGIFRPAIELKGFKKVFIKAGESVKVHIPFDERTFRYYNKCTNKWQVEEGSYSISIRINASKEVLSDMFWTKGDEAPKPYIKETIPDYFKGTVENIDDYQFETVLDIPIPDGSWKGKLRLNDSICQLYYAKSGLARFVYKILTFMKKRSEKKGKPNLNLLFIYNIPFRGIAKMTNGAVTADMVDGIVDIVNKESGGFRKLIKAAKRRKHG